MNSKVEKFKANGSRKTVLQKQITIDITWYYKFVHFIIRKLCCVKSLLSLTEFNRTHVFRHTSFYIFSIHNLRDINIMYLTIIIRSQDTIDNRFYMELYCRKVYNSRFIVIIVEWSVGKDVQPLSRLLVLSNLKHAMHRRVYYIIIFTKQLL
jgi:hypothetical protein